MRQAHQFWNFLKNSAKSHRETRHCVPAWMFIGAEGHYFNFLPNKITFSSIFNRLCSRLFWRLVFTVGFGLAGSNFLAVAHATPRAAGKAIFSPKASPSERDWRAFFALGEKDRDRLWTDFSKGSEKGLAAWGWEWRLAWLRSCARDEGKRRCQGIFEQGLIDKALVVRAEAAERLGERFARTGNAEALRSLFKAAGDPRNFRNKAPLFAEEKILFAIHRIGGAEERLRTIAKTYQMQDYVHRLAQAERPANADALR